MVGQHVDALRGSARPVDHQRDMQVRTRPVHALRFVAERHAMPRRDNDDRIVQLARVAQGGQHASDLRIDITRRTAIAAREAFLIAVIKICAVKRNPGEPAVIFLCIALQPVYPLVSSPIVRLALRGWQ